MENKMPDENYTLIRELNEFLKSALPYVTTVVLSAWGGAVQHIQKIRKTKAPFKWKEFFFDLAISAFAGVLTYFLCECAGITGAKAAFLIAISGHMGTRAIASFEVLHSRILERDNTSNKK